MVGRLDPITLILMRNEPKNKTTSRTEFECYQLYFSGESTIDDRIL